jgi:uncharacterized repeat protein (TIGR03899 family)
MIEIKDLAGLSKPLTKLIEVVAKGVGAVSKSYLIKRDADAREYEIGKIIQAMSSLGSLKGQYETGKIMITAQGGADDSYTLLNTSVEETIVARLGHKEARRQQNLEKISQLAANELNDTASDTVSDEPVDDDWISRFFNSAQDVTSEKMQILWGKILAGEITSPNSYSLRTLEIVRNLTSHEAFLFAKVAKKRFDQENHSFLINPDNYKYILDALKINFGDILLLREVGLLTNNDITTILSTNMKEQYSVGVEHGPFAIVAEVTPGEKIRDINSIGFTNSGFQLSRLIAVEPDMDIVNKLASLIKTGNNIKVICGVIKDTQGMELSLTDVKEL